MAWRKAGVDFRYIPSSRTAALGTRPDWKGRLPLYRSVSETDSSKEVTHVCSCKKQLGCCGRYHSQDVTAELERAHDSLSGLQGRHPCRRPPHGREVPRNSRSGTRPCRLSRRLYRRITEGWRHHVFHCGLTGAPGEVRVQGAKPNTLASSVSMHHPTVDLAGRQAE